MDQRTRKILLRISVGITIANGVLVPPCAVPVNVEVKVGETAPYAVPLVGILPPPDGGFGIEVRFQLVATVPAGV